MTLVRKDTLQPWEGEALPRTVSTARLRYQDGREEEIKVEPYEVQEKHPSNIGSLWDDSSLDAVGLVKPEPFTAPAGKIATGLPRFVRRGGKVITESDVADAPEPEITITKAEYDRLKALDTQRVKAK